MNGESHIGLLCQCLLQSCLHFLITVSSNKMVHLHSVAARNYGSQIVHHVVLCWAEAVLLAGQLAWKTSCHSFSPCGDLENRMILHQLLYLTVAGKKNNISKLKHCREYVLKWAWKSSRRRVCNCNWKPRSWGSLVVIRSVFGSCFLHYKNWTVKLIATSLPARFCTR